MIDNLIKSILEQVSVLRARQAPEELIKTLPNGQWELLRKATPPVPDSPHAQANATTSRLFHHVNAIHEQLQPHFDKHVEQFRQAPWSTDEHGRASKKTSLEHFHAHPVDIPVHPALQVWGDRVEEKTGTRPNLKTLNGVRGALKQHLLDLPRGQIDLGHLNKLRESSKAMPTHMGDYPRHPDDAANLITESTRRSRILTNSDMEEIINHHVGDAKSLKEIHDKNGGIDAVEAMGRTLGANASPPAYSGLKLNKQVHTDLMDLMRPGWHKNEHTSSEMGDHWATREIARKDALLEKPGMDWDEQRRVVDERVPEFTGNPYETFPDGTYDPVNDPVREKAVDDTFSYAFGENPEGAKTHENAVIDRALYRFKQHHLKDRG